MKNQQPVLEYSAAAHGKGRWGFRFRSRNGRVLMSSEGYASLPQAEKGFVSLIKSIATNQYAVRLPKPPAVKPARRPARRSRQASQ